MVSHEIGECHKNGVFEVIYQCMNNTYLWISDIVVSNIYKASPPFLIVVSDNDFIVLGNGKG